MTEYTTVSTPKPLVNDVKRLIQKFGYWPSITAFVREAILEKMHREIEMQKTIKEAGG